MALRNPHVKLASYVRAGVLCLPVAGGISCLAHSLPETPDSISLTAIASANSCIYGVFIQSWNSAMISVVNSHGAEAITYLRASVDHSLVR